ncbi:MAG: hypothetical protein IRY99_17575 [Isosphaeraceae bacterium]|nr:hypothetical protein [Isosphaeraceae bacterium]
MKSIVSSALVCLGTASAALLLAAATAATAAPPPQEGQFGTIKGRLVWGGSEAPKPEVLIKQGDKEVKDANVCAATTLYRQDLVVDPQTKGVANGFAYIARPKGSNPKAVSNLLAEKPKVEIDQKNCEYIPHSIAAHKDQTFVFKSSDPIGHNIHYTGFSNSKNFALVPNGQAEEKLVAEPRPIPLKCDIHPWMSGTIMVFDHTFFDVTDKDGSFEIKGVPAGKQNLIVWQEKVGYVTPGASRGMEVDVKPGQVTDVGTIVLDPAKVKK